MAYASSFDIYVSHTMFICCLTDIRYASWSRSKKSVPFYSGISEYLFESMDFSHLVETWMSITACAGVTTMGHRLTTHWSRYNPALWATRKHSTFAVIGPKHMRMGDANEGIVKYTVSGILPYCLALNLFALNRKHTATFAFLLFSWITYKVESKQKFPIYSL